MYFLENCRLPVIPIILMTMEQYKRRGRSPETKNHLNFGEPPPHNALQKFNYIFFFFERESSTSLVLRDFYQLQLSALEGFSILALQIDVTANN